jgi:hypothetical protein
VPVHRLGQVERGDQRVQAEAWQVRVQGLGQQPGVQQRSAGQAGAVVAVVEQQRSLDRGLLATRTRSRGPGGTAASSSASTWSTVRTLATSWGRMPVVRVIMLVTGAKAGGRISDW